ncbi:SLC13 family permease [bacterium (Candidatus Blackallbacteria) CG17_big_fil_post_rev_8_21_14_2_50_48_46]|uniref:SLC13 family permease n=1 Tax=bacterium (Candidatus Blackallbacteria) CG17_big_fil_post_rev_8_21_14_2_50_48_46 TaxID=2014261 RepID=A0A2M7G6G6_9BACT|nr:MAG: SLC13 family permease [bacterium (Candidatus Blackallbacteria) CG18_big_fil_WC_8_21_14_2_50_49_26]PIW17220.1 MAG: SLC13 family permease [bacterium (Candidatus Blackallbacteria) CG17_big_fil_post_rev_8_21_14_2_50_48_46]PIW51011.1 MAG: SLC13 family permease [bacterium (Candidatus Blackallbacteria) CG13_big_fil_rev_8_21_14_2_50_49_14]
MSPLLITLLILLTTIVLFVSDLLRLDLVAVLMLSALMMTGVVSPEQALAGFSDPVVVMIASLFVVGGAILQTGTAQWLGSGVSKLTGNSEIRLLIVLMLAVALLSGFMSSTGTTAVFLPIALSLAQQAKLSPSRLLMPMAFASLLGGMLTLIGTPPNLVVSNTLKEAGLSGFGFFDFTLPGLCALIASILYFGVLGRKLLPQATKSSKDSQQEPKPENIESLLRQYEMSNQLRWAALPPGSSLFGKSLAELQLGSEYGIQILSARRDSGFNSEEIALCSGKTLLEPNQEVLISGDAEALKKLEKALGITWLRSEKPMLKMGGHSLGLAEMLLMPRSRLVGKTLAEFQFRERYRLHVLAIQRGNQLIKAPLAQLRLRFGDFLLVQGDWSGIHRLGLEKRDFAVLNLPEEAHAANPFKIGLTLFWLVTLLVLMLTGIFPLVTAILITASGMVLTRCLSMEEAYQSISWESVLLIAAMLPMSTALNNSGSTEALSHWLSQVLGGLGPYWVMGSLFLITSFCSLFISNTATTVLIAPVALQLALTLHYSPKTLLMVVALAASSAFATPVASPVNTMVLVPGGYTFKDYLKVGLPLQVLILLICLGVVPMIFGLK